MLRRLAPVGVAMAHASVLHGAHLTLPEAFGMELRIVDHETTRLHFAEGVRSVLVERRTPEWPVTWPVQLADSADRELWDRVAAKVAWLTAEPNKPLQVEDDVGAVAAKSRL